MLKYALHVCTLLQTRIFSSGNVGVCAFRTFPLLRGHRGILNLNCEVEDFNFALLFPAASCAASDITRRVQRDVYQVHQMILGGHVYHHRVNSRSQREVEIT